MKKLIFFYVLALSFTDANSQITKGNWLVGGSGSFTSFKIQDEKSHYIQLSPNIGYFFLDRFAAGLQPSYTYEKRGLSTFSSKKSGYYIGPFARYYFLPSEKQFNILIQGSYIYGIEKSKSSFASNQYTVNDFSFSAGPVIYFNSAVGLEFLFGYAQANYPEIDTKESRIHIGIGLQVHLEKRK